METDDRVVDEVYNITDTLPGHNHSGQASYIMYANNRCRHSECLKQFNEYRERLYARKLTGQFVDMRVTANRDEAVLKAALERIANDPELTGRLIPVLAGTVVTEVATDERRVQSGGLTEAAPTTDTPVAQEPAQPPLAPQGDQDIVLAYLRGHANNGRVFDDALTDMDLVLFNTKLDVHRFGAALLALSAAGLILVCQRLQVREGCLMAAPDPSELRTSDRLCAACSAVFGSLTGFDSHHLVDYSRRPAVECRDPRELGLVQNARGVWLTPAGLAKGQAAGERLRKNRAA